MAALSVVCGLMLPLGMGRQRDLLFRNAVLMAVSAFDPMDIMCARGAGKGSIHFLDIETTVGHLRVAGLAGCARILRMPVVTGETTQSLMNTHGRAIVA